jgi:hypothetical protein
MAELTAGDSAAAFFDSIKPRARGSNPQPVAYYADLDATPLRSRRSRNRCAGSH